MMLRLLPFMAFVAGVGDLAAQHLEKKLLTQEALTTADVARLGVFDTLAYGLDLGSASVDTTVVLSDSVLYSIIMVEDASATSASFYLMSFDRFHEHPVALTYVCSEPDVDQSLRRYLWTEHSVGHDRSIRAIEYDRRTRKDKYGNRDLLEMRAVRRRTWDVAPDGRILGGIWIAEK